MSWFSVDRKGSSKDKRCWKELSCHQIHPLAFSMSPEHKDTSSPLPCAVCCSRFMLCLQTQAAPSCHTTSLDAPALSAACGHQMTWIKVRGWWGAAEVMKGCRKCQCKRLRGCCIISAAQAQRLGKFFYCHKSISAVNRWWGNKRWSLLVVQDLGGYSPLSWSPTDFYNSR